MDGSPLILVVEDSRLTMKLLVDMLTAGGMAVQTALTGEEALAKIAESPPDLVLVDLMLPNMSGYEVCRHIKQQETTKHIPVIILTALEGNDAKLQALEAGCDDFLNKPVNNVELSNRVKSLLRIRRLQEQVQLRERLALSFKNMPLSISGSAISHRQRPLVVLGTIPCREVAEITDTLRQRDLDIAVAHDGNELMAEVLASWPDLVLVDNNLPGKNGFEICREIKGNSDIQHIPVVLMARLADLDSKLKGIELGADDYLIRPVNQLELAARVSSLLRKKKLHDSLFSGLRAAVYASITDSLTGLYNHGYFKEYLRTEFERCQQAKLPLSLLMVDIDHFKQLNDTRGHAFGDLALKEVAMVVLRNVRDIDLVARYGGEEFAVVLQADTEQASAVAERIGRAVAAHLIGANSSLATQVTVSIGCASFPQHSQNWQKLLEQADQALYQAKAAGRNRVCIYQG